MGLEEVFLKQEIDPAQVQWGNQHLIQIRKVNGHIGIKVEVYNSQESPFSYSVVTKVKKDCHHISKDHLKQWDRIVFIGDQNVTSFTRSEFLEYISSQTRDTVDLVVCSPIPHSPDYVFCSTRNVTAKYYIMPNKRVKNCDNRNSGENDPLLCLSGQPSPEPQPNSIMLKSYCKDVHGDQINSLPAVLSSNIQYKPFVNDSPEVTHSLPVNTKMTEVKPLRVPPQNSSACVRPEMLFKHPNRVKWDGVTKTVELTKGPNQNFGFTFKVKAPRAELNSSIMTSDDIFTLVEKIEDGGPADGKLQIGDWIRSINGNPVQTPRDATNIRESLEKENMAKIVFQRPEGMSLTLHEHGNKTCNGIDAATSVASPQGPSVLTAHEQIKSSHNHPGSKSKADLFVNNKVMPPKQDAFSSKMSNAKHDFHSVESDSTCKNLTFDGSSLADISMIFPEIFNHDTPTIKVEHLNRVLKLPKIRMFICGSEAKHLAKLIFRTIHINENCSKLYQCYRFTMEMDNKGKISIQKDFRPFEHILQDFEPVKVHDNSDSLDYSGSLNSSEDNNSTCQRGWINVELYIVTEEKFFHHCCHYLFTGTSIFVLTFDGTKILKSAHGEIKHLQDMIHTIRCYDNYECPILTYGLLNPCDGSDVPSVTIDEVRTLFYLPFGNQIRKYSVPMPELFCPGGSGEEKTTEVSNTIKRELWKVMSEMIIKQNVLLPSITMMIQLDRYRLNSCQCIRETDFAQMFQTLAPGGGLDMQQMVWTDLKNVGEILSSKAAPLMLQRTQNLDKFLFVDPEILLSNFQSLKLLPSKPLQTNESLRNKYVRLVSHGMVTQEDLLTMLQIMGSYQTLHTDVIQLLEAFGLIFRNGISIDGSLQFTIPYFISESSSQRKESAMDYCLYMQFTSHVPSIVFYQLVFGLSSEAENRVVTMQQSCQCSLSHMGYEFVFEYEKLKDRIIVGFNRLDKTIKPSAAFHWLLQTWSNLLGSENPFIFGPVCPLKDHCVMAQSNGADIHIVDVSKGIASCCCGTSRLESHKAIKLWDVGAHNKTAKLQMYTSEIPYSLLHKISVHLLKDSALGKDWKGLAGLLDVSFEDVSLYETQKDPSIQFLIDFGRSRRLTIAILLELLNDSSMERLDVVKLIEDWLAE